MKLVTRLHERLDGRETERRGLRGAGYVRDRYRGHSPPGIAPKRKTNPRSTLESAKVLKNEPKTNPNEPNLGAPALAEALQNQRCFERPPRTNPKRTHAVIRPSVCLNCLRECGLQAIPAKRAELQDRAVLRCRRGLDVYTARVRRPSPSRWRRQRCPWPSGRRYPRQNSWSSP
jgi:hypothetical protein